MPELCGEGPAAPDNESPKSLTVAQPWKMLTPTAFSAWRGAGFARHFLIAGKREGCGQPGVVPADREKLDDDDDDGPIGQEQQDADDCNTQGSEQLGFFITVLHDADAEFGFNTSKLHQLVDADHQDVGIERGNDRGLKKRV